MGKLNILQHKSWHVYSAKNRERVRRDEEKAALEEEEKRQRSVAADQEVRLDQLRKRSRQSQQHPIDLSKSVGDAALEALEAAKNEGRLMQNDDGHINFFADLEKGKGRTQKGDAEYEAEKQAAKDKLEGQFTMYLGGDGKSKKPIVPWYARAQQDSDIEAKNKSKDAHSKNLMDPLAVISKSVSMPAPLPSTVNEEEKDEDRERRSKKAKKKKEKSKKKKRKSSKKKRRRDDRSSSSSSSSSSSESSPSSSSSSSEDESRRKRHKKKSKRDDPPTLSLEQLRAQRIQREEAERSRSRQLFPKAPDVEEEKAKAKRVRVFEAEGYYHSQFQKKRR